MVCESSSANTSTPPSHIIATQQLNQLETLRATAIDLVQRESHWLLTDLTCQPASYRKARKDGNGRSTGRDGRAGERGQQTLDGMQPGRSAGVGHGRGQLWAVAEPGRRSGGCRSRLEAVGRSGAQRAEELAGGGVVAHERSGGGGRVELWHGGGLVRVGLGSTWVA
jgi:hypothetical protein